MKSFTNSNVLLPFSVRYSIFGETPPFRVAAGVVFKHYEVAFYSYKKKRNKHKTSYALKCSFSFFGQLIR
jgi:hypothetical protein